MIAQQVAKKYARALFLSVEKKRMLDTAADQFVGLRPLVAEDDSLLNFLTAPQIPEERKIELVRSVFGKRVDRLVLEFLLVLVDKHRVNFLPEIIDEFERLVKDAKGIVQVKVITAVELTGPEEKRIISNLTARTGKKIELMRKVDPSIIGGMIIMMQNEIIDGSIGHYLEMIEEQLAGVKVY